MVILQASLLEPDFQFGGEKTPWVETLYCCLRIRVFLISRAYHSTCPPPFHENYLTIIITHRHKQHDSFQEHDLDHFDDEDNLFEPTNDLDDLNASWELHCVWVRWDDDDDDLEDEHTSSWWWRWETFWAKEDLQHCVWGRWDDGSSCGGGRVTLASSSASSSLSASFSSSSSSSVMSMSM